MSRFKSVCSVILVFSIITVVITLSQGLILRTQDAYMFYFNDSQCVDRLYTSLTSDDMAAEIAGFMNSFHPEEFQVHDFTGYDELPIFDSRDSYNMMVLKKIVDISSICGIAAFILMVSIYIWFIREDEKKILRNSFRVASAVSILLIIVQALVISAGGLRDSYFRLWGMRTAAEDSKLEMILGDEFWSVAAVFMTGISLAVLAVLTYINYRLTRPPRIFY